VCVRYVTLGADVLFSQLTQVASNVVIFGNMTKIGPDAWYINAVDTSTNVNTDLTVTRTILSSQPWIYVTLEVYDVGTCDQYPPAGSKFSYSKIQLFEDGKEVSPQWSVGTQGQTPPICNAQITINTPAHLTPQQNFQLVCVK